MLLERERALDAAHVLLEQTRRGHGGAVFVVAEAGLGKTTILESARQLAEDRGFVLGWSRGDAMEGSLPFGFLAQAFEDLGAHEDLHGADSELFGPDARSRYFRAALRWLERHSETPVLLTLDDLHWADSDSLALLSFLCRRMRSLHAAVIGTLRPWPPEAQDLAARLAHDGYATTEHLAALTMSSSAALLRDRAGRQISDVDVERAWWATAGNPLLLEQVGLAMRQGENAPGRTDAGRGAAAKDLLLARFAGLPPSGMRCAQAAAVFGVRFRPGLALRLAHLEESEADAVLDALHRSGLVRGDADGVGFAHPLFRQALYDDLGTPVQSRFHTLAFRLLVDQGLEAEAAEHAIQADLVGDVEAIAVLARVGRAARRAGALESAVRLLRAAVALAGDKASADLLLELAEAMIPGGLAREAIDSCAHVLELPDLSPMIQARAHRALAQALVFTGSFDAAATPVDDCVEIVKDIDATFAVQTLLAYSLVAYLASGPAQTLSVTRRARLIAQSCGELAQQQADAVWAATLLECGDPSGLVMSEAAARRAETELMFGSTDVSNYRGGALASYASAAKHVERFDASEHFYRLHLGLVEQLGVVEEEAWSAMGYADTLIRRLRLSEAMDQIDRCADLSDLLPLAAPFAGVGRVIVLLLMGRIQESDDWRARVEPMLTELGAWWGRLWLWDTRAWRYLSEGHFAEACELYEQIEATAAGAGIGEPCLVPWAGHAIAAYVGSGREADAVRVIAGLDDAATRLPCRWPRITAAVGRARLAESEGENEEADGLFAIALDLHKEVDLSLERLQTLLAYGTFSRRAGRLEQARRLLAQAAELGETSGSAWLAGQAREELRVAGGRRRRRADPSRLTPQEQRVAALAATGATNQEIANKLFLAVSTIETHLERIYTKLGIHSRRELILRHRPLDGE